MYIPEFLSSLLPYILVIVLLVISYRYKRQIEQWYFRGQVSGFLAGLSIAHNELSLSSSTFVDIYRLAGDELDRCQKIKDRARPTPDQDPFYYEQHAFGSFVRLCIEKYAREKVEDEEEAAALLDLCDKRGFFSHVSSTYTGRPAG